MSANEIGLGLTFLQSTLGNDTTLSGYAPGGVHRALAPPGTTTPFVIHGFQAGSDTVTMNGVRLFVPPLFLVKVVGPSSITETLITAANQVDSLLGGIQGLRNIAITGGEILACYRETPLQLDELVNGELFSNFGGLYRLIIQASS